MARCRASRSRPSTPRSSCSTDLGLALRVHAGRAVRFDPRSEPHHHLVCTSCGAVADLDADVELGPALERARALGAETSGAEVVVRGLCADCAA